MTDPYIEQNTQKIFESLVNGESVDILRSAYDHDLLREKLAEAGIDQIYIYGDENDFVMRLTEDPQFYDKNAQGMSVEEAQQRIAEIVEQHGGKGTAYVDDNEERWSNSQFPEYGEVVDRSLALDKLHIEVIQNGLDNPSGALLEYKYNLESELGRDITREELQDHLKDAAERADIHMDMLTEDGLSQEGRTLTDKHIDVYNSLTPEQQDSFMERYVQDNREVLALAEQDRDVIAAQYDERLNDPSRTQSRLEILKEKSDALREYDKAVSIKGQVERVSPHSLNGLDSAQAETPSSDLGGVNGNAVTYAVASAATHDSTPNVDLGAASVTVDGKGVVDRFNTDLANPSADQIVQVDAKIDQAALAVAEISQPENNSVMALSS